LTFTGWVPAVDVWETENEVVYAFDLPGIPEDKISVEFEDGALTVSAERERKQEFSEENLYGFERRFGTFTRVAKPEQSKPRRIQIGGGEQKTIEGKATKA